MGDLKVGSTFKENQEQPRATKSLWEVVAVREDGGVYAVKESILHDGYHCGLIRRMRIVQAFDADLRRIR